MYIFFKQLKAHHFSDENWVISPPNYDLLVDSIKDNIDKRKNNSIVILMEYEIVRSVRFSI